MQEAVQAKSWPIVMLEKSQSGVGEAILQVLIIDAISFFNIGKNMNAQQIKSTVELLLTDIEAKNLKPEDYKVIFKNAKRGDYGRVYDRLDGQVIFEWVRAYAAERMSFCEQNSIKQHGENKKATNLVHPKVIEMYKEAAKLAEKKEEEIKEIPERKPYQKTERDQFIQETFRAFEKEKGTEIRGQKFVILSGKEVDQVEYAQIKLKAYDEDRQKRTDTDKEAL